MAIQKILKELSFILTGLFVFFGVCLLLVLSIPSYLFRFLISKIFAPIYFGGGKNGKLVGTSSNAMSIDILERKRSPRANIVVNCVIDGYISYEELFQKIQEKWINSKDKSGNLKYPEFQMFMEMWLGYMCFKRNKNFDLNNHLKQIKLDENGSESDSTNFYMTFIENLLNKNFKVKQSPWKVYLVNNYKNSNLSIENRNLTLIAFHFHHSLADGYAIMYLTAEQLLGNKLDKIVVKPSVKRRYNGLKNVLNLSKFPIQVLREFGQIINWKTKETTIYHVSDYQKNWRQIFRKAPLIPMNKVKVIKNRFGVSFASVINSACSLALGKMMKKLEMKRGNINKYLPENIVFGVPIPKPNHPKTLTNHALCVGFDAPIKPEMGSIERLKECEKQAKRAVMSPMPIVFQFAIAVSGAHPTILADILIKNRDISAGVTNFPGPGTAISWDGKFQVLAADCEVGALPGVAGVAFMASSYVDNLQICGTAENSIFCHEDLQELLDLVCLEIDHLFDLATCMEENL